jgi:hypothetical protein
MAGFVASDAIRSDSFKILISRWFLHAIGVHSRVKPEDVLCSKK